ncbi:MAG: hypothetical protein WBZ36_23685 [Candidatus Nitrosopolaris sp.]
MNPNSVHGYTSLDKTGKDAELDKTSLDILELFAVHREKYMWTYQVFSKLKSTPGKMAYKNVNKRVKALLLSGLIQEIARRKITRKIAKQRNAKYYMLTEYGIYQLFLKKFKPTTSRTRQDDGKRLRPSILITQL